MSETRMPVPELSELDLAFPAGALDWMPLWEEIPDDFKEGRGDARKWVKIANVWFAVGLAEGVEFYPHPGVDAEQAFHAVRATLGSYAPEHKHKIAAVAYMLSSWFVEIKGWEKT